MMQRLLLLLIVLAPATAHAGEPPSIAPPSWNRDAERSDVITKHLAKAGHFGAGAARDARADVYAVDGGALIVSRVEAARPAELAAAVRAELDLVRGEVRAAGLDGSRVHELGWQERVVEGRLVEGRLEWRHESNGTLSRTRLLIGADDAGIAVASAECLLRDDRADALRPACDEALGRLSLPGPRQWVAIAIGPAGAAAPAAATTDAPSGVAPREPPRLSEPHGPALPPILVPPQPASRDRRPLYLIGGLLLAAALFIWNHGRRKAQERSDEGRSSAGAEPEAATAGDDEDEDEEDDDGEPHHARPANGDNRRKRNGRDDREDDR